jgi:hypothetical protein
MCGLMPSSKQHLYSITTSARASTDGGEVEVDHLGGLEVDYKPILGWRLHRQVGESRTSLLE